MTKGNTAAPQHGAAALETVQQRFKACAERHAERTALRVPSIDGSGGWQLTYRELDQWSDELAAQLRAASVDAGARVGIYAKRSAAAVAALLAVVKVGATYVPLGLDYPEERIRFTIEDTGLRCVFAAVDHFDVASSWGIPTLTLGESPDSFASSCKLELAFAGHCDDCAYILYTSGSTGRPKGVEVSQRGILRLVDPANIYCHFDAERRFLLLAPLTFDAATFEIWGALLNGACCVIYPREGLPDPAELAGLLRRERITTLWLTASLFNWLIDNEALIDVSVSELLVGGEALSVPHVRRAQLQMPGTQLINGYGPTETTTFACCYRIPRALPDDLMSVPIGFPIARTPIFIVDDKKQPVAIGAEGDLYIGGDGVALGYRNLPEQTAARFVELTINGVAERVYATGDRVRQRANGAIEYCGRTDDQVKISGYRIELGEINHAFKLHTDVRDAVTFVREVTAGQRHLIAYVAADTEKVSATILRQSLSSHLPHYMVPTQIIVVEKLPINANGKVDRNALRALDEIAPQRSEKTVADVRSRLHKLWCETLSKLAVEDEDSFYASGGTSLLYMGMVTRAGREFSLPLRTLDIFEFPTFGALCQELEKRCRELEQRTDGNTSHKPDAEQVRAIGERNAAIAIIGVAARVPGARNARQYWANLIAGLDTISHFSDAELDPSIPADLRSDTDYVKARGIIPEAEYFDAAFFGISAGEAAIIDPQQRVFLETAWEALEDAGIAPDREAAIGVFAGTGANTYFLSNVLPVKGVDAGVGELARALASEKDYVATRTAFKLGLTGPAVSVHTACSTSLVAVVQAVDSLRGGHCKVAIAGGVSINTPLHSGYLSQEGGMLSPDGV
ncbi:MAG TPA: amino acid adenylation domain-containing protein, partial [Spongiibacteraceae bacterium]